MDLRRKQSGCRALLGTGEAEVAFDSSSFEINFVSFVFLGELYLVVQMIDSDRIQNQLGRTFTVCFEMGSSCELANLDGTIVPVLQSQLSYRFLLPRLLREIFAGTVLSSLASWVCFVWLYKLLSDC
tara:strand:+ start:1091 stop:1471 length:381 start_codon:yes stop_codon:yes gene_type:complete